jgi:hypothetical protein
MARVGGARRARCGREEMEGSEGWRVIGMGGRDGWCRGVGREVGESVLGVMGLGMDGEVRRC